MGGDEDEEGSGRMADMLAEMSGEGASGSGNGSGIEIGSGSGENESEEEEDEPLEYVEVAEDFYYMAHVIRLMAILHAIVSLAMLVAYYHLKVQPFLYRNSLYLDCAFVLTCKLAHVARRYRWPSSNGKRKLRDAWSSMVCTSLKRRKKTTSKCTGTRW